MVICIDSKGVSKLVEGKEYSIIDSFKCCGKTAFNVGVHENESGNYRLMECPLCFKVTRKRKLGTYYKADRFIPNTTDKELEEEIFESLKGEKIYLHKELKEY